MSGPRRPLVAGNWKMHKTMAEAREHCVRLRELLGDAAGPTEVAVCPPFTALATAAQALAGSAVRVFAQAVHEAPHGAHTGEIAVSMVGDAGAAGTIVGHSERRAAGETDDQVAARVRAALDGGLRVILCVGESLAQRESGETESWLTGQIRAALAAVDLDAQQRLAIAYEPIWAIGTGRTATPDVAQSAIAHCRAVASERLDGAAIRILYGGSVTPDNARELMDQPDVDGALVGGASLDPDSFASIVRGATP